jgi:hypothetical protein
MKKLDELDRMMDVSALTREIKNHRATMLPPSRRKQQQYGSSSSSSSPSAAMEEKLSGQLKIEVAYSENLKPCNKNGLANPYLTIRVPEDTIVPPSKTDEEVKLDGLDGNDNQRPSPVTSSNASGGGGGGEKQLTGKECELIRTRVVYDSINASWNEAFQCILPPVDKLEILVNSKNLISSDETIGVCDIDLSRGTRLRRKLDDHQTHDLFGELEPQGRVLIRLTLEGEDEDVGYWFRKTRERLGRTRDDFMRTLTVRVSSGSQCVESVCASSV